MISSALADVLGFLGALTILAGYAYQTLRQVPPDLLSGSLNFAGATLLGVSLTVHYNLPALCLEFAWAAIALAGLVRLRWRRA